VSNAKPTNDEGATTMPQTIFSLDHRLAEIRQVGDDLRAERYADQVRQAGRRQGGSMAVLFRDLFSSLQTPKANRLATH